MGYLTTFTVYNDGVHLVKENAQDFADKIYDAAVTPRSATFDIAIGNFGNLVRAQKCRHADDNTIYAHMGNSVFEMNPYSDETKKLAERNPEFFKRVVKFLEKEVKDLKAILKEAKK
jgi:hypothetical protein